MALNPLNSSHLEQLALKGLNYRVLYALHYSCMHVAGCADMLVRCWVLYIFVRFCLCVHWFIYFIYACTSL